MGSRSRPTLPGVDRIAIVSSCPGAGKTSLARRLARLVTAPHVELDGLFWDPDWRPVDLAVFRGRVAAAAAGRHWVLDGNYEPVWDIVWSKADTLVWLDYPLPLALARLVGRSVRQLLTRTPLWAGNRESLRMLFSSRSIFAIALATYQQRRRALLASLSDPAHAHLRVVHLRSPREAETWLRRIEAAAGRGAARVEVAA